MFTEHRNHEQALWMMHTGLIVAGRPSLGAWVAYGLGHREPEPARLRRAARPERPAGGRHPQLVERLDAAAVPGHAVPLRGHAGPEPAAEGRPPAPPSKRAGLDLLATLNAEHRAATPGELELDARIASFELAAAMQLAATDALDLSQETAARSDAATASTTR